MKHGHHGDKSANKSLEKYGSQLHTPFALHEQLMLIALMQIWTMQLVWMLGKGLARLGRWQQTLSPAAQHNRDECAQAARQLPTSVCQIITPVVCHPVRTGRDEDLRQQNTVTT
jgi:hypothetical protein